MSKGKSMKYQWERFVDGEWRPVCVQSLPDWLKKKKAVLFASRGIEMTRDDRDGGEERYRMIKRSEVDPPAR